MQQIHEDSIVAVAKEQTSSQVDREVVVLHLKSEEYYGLNPVGSTIWNLLQQPKKVSEIREAILTQYDVDQENCDRDLFEFLQKLEAEKLIEVQSPVLGAS